MTLTVDKELLRESKAYLAEKNLTVSGTLEAKSVMMAFLGEVKRLGKARSAGVVPISGPLIAEAVAPTLKQQIYIADALQVVSCRTVTDAGFVTADPRLAGVARVEGLKAVLIG